ncbi:fimbrial protein [Pseudomonas sp. IT-P176]|uniref:fimbrial protein n=1 Tax=Pseudomonas sp. IT-P176 TaxID=3026444 RepID=UPI0039E091FC
MTMMRIFRLGAALIGLALVTGVAMADCNFINGYGPALATMPLQAGNITVGRDVPLGAEIYRQTFSNAKAAYSVTCGTNTGAVNAQYELVSKPLPLSAWMGAPWGGNVYQTGVAGIGVVVLTSGVGTYPMPYTAQVLNCPLGNNCTWSPAASGAFILSFIKIGPVSAGTIQGSQLPTMSMNWNSSNALFVQRVNFSGSINIVSRTCTTPNVVVEMGSHKVGEFSVPGSVTGWKDFSINLYNCPAFHGFYKASGPGWGTDGVVTNLNKRQANVLQVRIDPTLGAYNPAQGILSLNPSAPGDSPAATGVGLQIGTGSGTPFPLSVLRPSGITPSGIEGGFYSIPLKARYFQFGGSVTPGPANATATFTLDYQ